MILNFKKKPAMDTNRQKMAAVARYAIGVKAETQLNKLTDKEWEALDKKLKDGCFAKDKEIASAMDSIGSFMQYHTAQKKDITFAIALARVTAEFAKTVYKTDLLEPLIDKMTASEYLVAVKQILAEELKANG